MMFRFHLWKQRNKALHNNTLVAPSVIARLIYMDVKNTILARRNHKEFRSLLSFWIV